MDATLRPPVPMRLVAAATPDAVADPICLVLKAMMEA
ncbi:hypothetical protein MCP1_70125 [Candidatus Terasakiella magnetica]|nr:hypothetical protein MCP1_70125 [Candidatus Terasakiella magnetica]